MKNAKNIIAVAMIAMTITTYASANTTINTTEDKAKVSVAVNPLPTTLPILESPAPQVEKKSNDSNKQNAIQKAAIVELQLKSQSTK
jgi:hypothetical protein